MCTGRKHALVMHCVTAFPFACMPIAGTCDRCKPQPTFACLTPNHAGADATSCVVLHDLCVLNPFAHGAPCLRPMITLHHMACAIACLAAATVQSLWSTWATTPARLPGRTATNAESHISCRYVLYLAGYLCEYSFVNICSKLHPNEPKRAIAGPVHCHLPANKQN